MIDQTPDLSREQWDVVVIGGGVAGSVAAHQLAKQGASTLLVEAKALPRPKVCGGCLNPRAVAALDELGLGDALRSCQPAEYDRLEVFHRQRSFAIGMPSGLSVSRGVMDESVVLAAESQGVRFMPQASAKVGSVQAGQRRVQIRTNKGERAVRARVVLACDGLGRTSLSQLSELPPPAVAKDSRVGLGAVLEASQAGDACPAGRIQMAVGQAGYVGMARCESNRLSIAAAIDPAALAAARNPGELIRRLIEESGAEPPAAIEACPWRGTRPLTQSSLTLGAERLFLLGDAAGYVEPFTGEGMAAAIEGARRVVPLALKAIAGWDAALLDAWHDAYARHIRSRQKTIHSLAWLMRRPSAMRVAFALTSSSPGLGALVARWVSRESHHGTRRAA